MAQLITDLHTIARLAEERRDEFEVIRYQFEFDDDLSDEEIDRFVDEISTPIISAVDCTACANCCRSLTIQIGTDDIEWLATGLRVSTEQFCQQHIEEQSDEDAPHVTGTFRQKPCHFLGGNLCTVYEYRPEACRAYPQFTPDFRWMFEWMLDGARVCPIIYNVLDQISTKFDDFQYGNAKKV